MKNLSLRKIVSIWILGALLVTSFQLVADEAKADYHFENDSFENTLLIWQESHNGPNCHMARTNADKHNGEYSYTMKLSQAIAGEWMAISQVIGIPVATSYTIAFWNRDVIEKDESLSGGYGTWPTKQLLVDGQVIWEENMAHDGTEWHHVEQGVTREFRDKTTAEVTLRYYVEEASMYPLLATMFWDDVRLILDSLTPIKNIGFEQEYAWQYYETRSEWEGVYDSSEGKHYGGQSYRISWPLNTISNPGDYASISQDVVLPPASQYFLDFWHKDDRSESHPVGYHVKQVLVGGSIVWSVDMAGDPDNVWQHERKDITNYVTQRDTTIELRFYEQSRVWNYRGSVWFDVVYISYDKHTNIDRAKVHYGCEQNPVKIGQPGWPGCYLFLDPGINDEIDTEYFIDRFLNENANFYNFYIRDMTNDPPWENGGGKFWNVYMPQLLKATENYGIRMALHVSIGRWPSQPISSIPGHEDRNWLAMGVAISEWAEEYPNLVAVSLDDFSQAYNYWKPEQGMSKDELILFRSGITLYKSEMALLTTFLWDDDDIGQLLTDLDDYKPYIDGLAWGYWYEEGTRPNEKLVYRKDIFDQRFDTLIERLDVNHVFWVLIFVGKPSFVDLYPTAEYVTNVLEEAYTHESPSGRRSNGIWIFSFRYINMLEDGYRFEKQKSLRRHFAEYWIQSQVMGGTLKTLSGDFIEYGTWENIRVEQWIVWKLPEYRFKGNGWNDYSYSLEVFETSEYLVYAYVRAPIRWGETIVIVLELDDGELVNDVILYPG